MIKNIIFIIVMINFIQCQSVRQKSKIDPRSLYEICFNAERAKRGIPIIQDDYQRWGNYPMAYQLWVNMKDTVPRHWRKRVICDSKGWEEIVAEVDDFLVKTNEDTIILRFVYEFDNERKKQFPWKLNLYEFIPPKEPKQVKTKSIVTDSNLDLEIKDSLVKVATKKIVEKVYRNQLKRDSLRHFEIESLFGDLGKKIKEIDLDEADRILKINNLKRKKSL